MALLKHSEKDYKKNDLDTMSVKVYKKSKIDTPVYILFKAHKYFDWPKTVSDSLNIDEPI